MALLGNFLALHRNIANKSFYRPASEASREVANLDDPNLTEIKNPHTPVYGVRKFVCLSLPNLTPIIID